MSKEDKAKRYCRNCSEHHEFEDMDEFEKIYGNELGLARRDW